jgi:hypothetical protein
MICVWCLFIGAWEHPTMPLTKREAEIHNKPLGKAAMRAVWNQIHNKIDPNIGPVVFGRASFSLFRNPLIRTRLSRRVNTFENPASAWEVVFR